MGKLLTQEHFYQWFKLLLVALLILNIADTVTTIIGVYYIDNLAESNTVLIPFLESVQTFLILKLVFLSGFFLAALGYLIKVHHAFPKLWENEVALLVAGLVVLFYFLVVANNLVLIIINTA